MTYKTLLYEKRQGVGYVTVNRPEKLNALSRLVIEELKTCFESIQKDAEISVAIVTGAGDRAFIAGADLNEVAASTPAEGREASLRAQALLTLIENLGKPVIAAIRGYALGGGCELAMACTLRVASENARFGQPEVKIGLIPGYGGSQRLPRLVGKGRALEMILTGEPISAEEAYRIGLVNLVTPDEKLMTSADALARKIMANAPQAVKLSMEAVNHGLEMTEREGEFLEAALFSLCCATEDMKEGTRAFLEKRSPKFKGR
ncbi:MAG TPA: enoyl-CoA hydratase-related protein [Terriglobia bacterium]|nr:enoyl-CoA hydratase-related protein [Terriglobia bacterium]